MERVTGIFTGRKLEIEEIKGKENKLAVNLYVLSGHESLKMAVRDNELWKELKAIPDMEPLKLKAEVSTFKDKLYMQALELIS